MRKNEKKREMNKERESGREKHKMFMHWYIIFFHIWRNSEAQMQNAFSFKKSDEYVFRLFD